MAIVWVGGTNCEILLLRIRPGARAALNQVVARPECDPPTRETWPSPAAAATVTGTATGIPDDGTAAERLANHPDHLRRRVTAIAI